MSGAKNRTKIRGDNGESRAYIQQKARKAPGLSGDPTGIIKVKQTSIRRGFQ